MKVSDIVKKNTKLKSIDITIFYFVISKTINQTWSLKYYRNAKILLYAYCNFRETHSVMHTQ